VRDKEILNASNQMEMNNIELKALETKLNELSGVNKLITLETRLKNA
jgi:hypothetical protein